MCIRQYLLAKARDKEKRSQTRELWASRLLHPFLRAVCTSASAAHRGHSSQTPPTHSWPAWLPTCAEKASPSSSRQDFGARTRDIWNEWAGLSFIITKQHILAWEELWLILSHSPSQGTRCRSVMWHSLTIWRQSLLIFSGIKHTCSPKWHELWAVNWLCGLTLWGRTFIRDALQSSRIHRNSQKQGNCPQFLGPSLEISMKDRRLWGKSFRQLCQQHLVQH